MPSYLKPKQEYADFYDRLTVDHCREKEKINLKNGRFIW